MSLAKVNAMRSKDPNTQVGAIIVNSDKRVVGMGYNGMPQGNDDFSWEREAKSKVDTKYPYVIHAELNAILNSNVLLKNKILYSTLFPCSNCAKIISQSGISKVVFADEKYRDSEDDKIAKKIFDDLNIKYVKLDNFKVKIEK